MESLRGSLAQMNKNLYVLNAQCQRKARESDQRIRSLQHELAAIRGMTRPLHRSIRMAQTEGIRLQTEEGLLRSEIKVETDKCARSERFGT